MYLVVNVENLKLYEHPMVMDQDESIQVPYVDDFAPEYLNELQEDSILDRKIRTSCRGEVEYLRVGIKGVHPSKAWWMEIGKVRELYPLTYLLSKSDFWFSKSLQWGGLIQVDLLPIKIDGFKC